MHLLPNKGGGNFKFHNKGGYKKSHHSKKGFYKKHGGGSRGMEWVSFGSGFLIDGLQGRYDGCEGGVRIGSDVASAIVSPCAGPFSPLANFVIGEIGDGIGEDICTPGYSSHSVEKGSMRWGSDGKIIIEKEHPTRHGSHRYVHNGSLKDKPEKKYAGSSSRYQEEGEYYDREDTGNAFGAAAAAFSSMQWGDDGQIIIVKEHRHHNSERHHGHSRHYKHHRGHEHHYKVNHHKRYKQESHRRAQYGHVKSGHYHQRQYSIGQSYKRSLLQKSHKHPSYGTVFGKSWNGSHGYKTPQRTSFKGFKGPGMHSRSHHHR